MDIDQFITERQPSWHQLECLLDTAEQAPPHALGPERLQTILGLYRRTCSDLNQARSYTANPELLARLNQLTGRGYRFVYRGGRITGLKAAAERFLSIEVPATFRREIGYVLAAAAAFVGGALIGLVAVLVDPANARSLVPGEFFTDSPRARVERIEHEKERIDTLADASQFGAQLFTHNIQVTFLAFSLGALTLVGGIWILFYNGAILGAVAATYLLDGVHLFFFAWVGPHGALELPAIVFGGAAGLRAGRALLTPGDRSRSCALRAAFPAVWRMMILVCLVLVLAGIVEGSFSQFSAKTIPYSLKIGIAVVLFSSLQAYLFARRPGADERTPGAPG